mmetsp:Transcript_19776/g.42047  ORF Transcript_19776/g.42047 Transcript_19776/m.42047 type:complete len:318 (+) Transcript_19776:670-1623(+)
MLRGVGDVFDRHGNAKLPDEHLLVVGGGGELTVLLAEGDGVDRAEVLVVDLLHLAGVGVVLHDVLVRAAGHDDVLLVCIRVDLHAVRELLVGQRGDALAGLSVPQLEVPVVRAGDEAAAIVGEADVPNRCGVSHVRAHALLRVEHIPDLHLRVHSRREQEVAIAREPTDGGDAFGVARPRVHPPLGDEALVLLLADVDWRREPRAPLIVSHVRPVEDGLLLHRLLRLQLRPALALALLLLVPRGDRLRLLLRQLRLGRRDGRVRLVEAQPLALLLHLGGERRLHREDALPARLLPLRRVADDRVGRRERGAGAVRLE